MLSPSVYTSVCEMQEDFQTRYGLENSSVSALVNGLAKPNEVEKHTEALEHSLFV